VGFDVEDVVFYFLNFVITIFLVSNFLAFDHKHKHSSAICFFAKVFMQLKWVLM